MFERILSRRSDLSRHRNGPYAEERERYLTLLMEEGRSRPTLRQIANLLYHMAEQLPLSLPSVTPTQIEAAARQWSTTLTTISNHVKALRNFFRFAQSMNWCVPGLANTIEAPRIYKLERLPRGPLWSDVQRLLGRVHTNVIYLV
jgi:site-specific recombinase XerD